MLETIYEVDEEIHTNEDSSKSSNTQSQLSVYMCWCMLTGCFIILTFIIMISLNPQYLVNNSTNNNTLEKINSSFHSEEKFEISSEIINYLSIFSHQINKQLDLQLNPVIFLTLPISNLSLDEFVEQDKLLWIYGYLNYSQSCMDNNKNKNCKEIYFSKFKTIFMKLSNFINTIKLNTLQNKRIQYDWCNLRENSKTVTFASVVSITTISKNVTETPTSFDHSICDDPNQNILLAKSFEYLMSHEDLIIINSGSNNSDNQQVSSTSDPNSNNNITDEQIKYITPSECVKFSGDDNNQNKDTTYCPNDTGSQYHLMWNSY
ncbi:unnamed protein product [Adineta steineri]|uniref:Transmembrane protein n=1 Tax=Adineta steineri TaxID=433720 RepID=A0A815RD26_9BILA|nr:unnamed protein product [Adineta steineri]